MPCLPICARDEKPNSFGLGLVRIAGQRETRNVVSHGGNSLLSLAFDILPGKDYRCI